MNRRAFFKQLLGKGLDRGARQVDAVVIPFERAAAAAKAAVQADAAAEAALDDDALASLADAIEDGGEASAARTPLPADPVAVPCAVEDVMRLAADSGLVRRVEAVVALARQSVRLVPADEDPDSVAAPAGRSRFGGAPELPDDVAWPRWRGEPLTFLAQIDLAEVAAAGLDGGALPAEGLLLLFSAADLAPAGLAPGDFGSSRALLVDAAAAEADPAPPGPRLPADPTAIALSVEWVLPPADDPRVRALGLDADERTAWERLRAALADHQGVALERPDGDLHALHRLLGEPDDPRGEMPLTCELVAAGVDADPADRAAHPLIGPYRARSARWRLLAQLTVDDRLGWDFGAGRERLCFWVDERDLRAGVLAGVRAIAR